MSVSEAFQLILGCSGKVRCVGCALTFVQIESVSGFRSVEARFRLTGVECEYLSEEVA
jgi:hypothetical protein